MANEIYINSNEDSLSLDGDIIRAISDSKEYIFNLSEVSKLVILTSDTGPFDEDMWLVVYIGTDDLIFIPSGHKCCDAFLFDQIGNVLPIDHKNIIEASSCTENKEFVLYEKQNPKEFEESLEKSQSKTGIKIFKDKNSIKVSGSINLGYIGTFTDSQIELDDTLEDIREWDIVTENLDEDCSDDELIEFLNRYYNDLIEKIEKNIDNINGTFLLYVLTDMDSSEIDFMTIDELFIEDKLFYGNEEDIAEVYNTVRDGLNTLSAYLEAPNDGTIPKGHIESVLRSFYPMFDFDCFLANIIPEYINLNDGEISFQCSDNFDNAILCGAYGVIDEELSIQDWHNF